MKIKITDTNECAIDGALIAASGRAYSFTVATFDELQDIALRFARQLSEDGLTKKEMAGATLTYIHRGPDARSYKYGVKSTKITILIGANGKDLFLTSANSATVYPKSPEMWRIQLRSESKMNWLERIGARYD